MVRRWIMIFLVQSTMAVTTAAAQQPASESSPTQKTMQTEPTQTEQTEQGQFPNAGKLTAYRIRRLPLSAFPDLPVPVRTVLEQRHCMVPQTYEARRPENVIRGHFREKTSDDWAVLCSSQGTTSLTVFSGSAAAAVELASHRDQDRLSESAGDVSGYNWGIDVASPSRVRELSDHGSGNFDHDGIEDSTIERTSTIHYYRGSKWLTFERPE